MAISQCLDADPLIRVRLNKIIAGAKKISMIALVAVDAEYLFNKYV